MPRSFRILVLLAVMSLAAFAQTATVLGTVTDNTGAIVPGATVTITNTATQIQRVLQTNSAGNYNAPDLLIGPYSVKIEQKGFKTYDRTGLILNSNDTVRIDATMQVGELTESVTVAADAIQVQSDTSEISDTISRPAGGAVGRERAAHRRAGDSGYRRIVGPSRLQSANRSRRQYQHQLQRRTPGTQRLDDRRRREL